MTRHQNLRAIVIDEQPGTNDIIDRTPVTEQRGRGTSFVWEIGPGTDTVGRPVTVLAILECMHYRGTFLATLRRYEQGDVFRSTEFMLHEAAPFTCRMPVDRYSTKRGQAFAETALADLREHANDPAVLAVFGVEPTVEVRIDHCQVDSTLAWLQHLVGGSIEALNLADSDRMEGYVNEEGKLVGLARNEAATRFYGHKLSSSPYRPIRGDYIAGPMVLVGPLDADGDTTSVRDDVVDEVRAFLLPSTVEVVG